MIQYNCQEDVRNLRGRELNERNEKKFEKKFKFPLDKLFKLCYNKITKDKEIVAHYEVWEKVRKK